MYQEGFTDWQRREGLQAAKRHGHSARWEIPRSGRPRNPGLHCIWKFWYSLNIFWISKSPIYLISNLISQMFDDNGEYIKSIGDGTMGRCFGLATDGKGRIFTINTNHFGNKGTMTAKGEHDVFVFDVASGELKKRIELVDVIPADQKCNSKCRFLAYKRSRLHIVDLGINCIYVYNMKTNISRLGEILCISPALIHSFAIIIVQVLWQFWKGHRRIHRCCWYRARQPRKHDSGRRKEPQASGATIQKLSRFELLFSNYFPALQQEEGPPRRCEARYRTEAALRNCLWWRPKPEPGPLCGKLVGRLCLQIQPC